METPCIMLTKLKSLKTVAYVSSGHWLLCVHSFEQEAVKH